MIKVVITMLNRNDKKSFQSNQKHIALHKVAGKPLLQHILEDLILTTDYNVDECIILCNNINPETIRELQQIQSLIKPNVKTYITEDIETLVEAFQNETTNSQELIIADAHNYTQSGFKIPKVYDAILWATKSETIIGNQILDLAEENLISSIIPANTQKNNNYPLDIIYLKRSKKMNDTYWDIKIFM